MIRTGEYGYLLANGDRRFCFPVVRYSPQGTWREKRWGASHGMAPLGTYTARGMSPEMTMYVATLYWFDRHKKFIEAWPVDSFYSLKIKEFTFYMKVDGIWR